MGAGASCDLAASAEPPSDGWQHKVAGFLGSEEELKQQQPLTWGCGRRGRTFPLDAAVLDALPWSAADAATTTREHRDCVRALKQSINEIYCEAATERATPPPTPPMLALASAPAPAEKQVDWCGLFSKVATQPPGWDAENDVQLAEGAKKVLQDFSQMNAWLIESAMTQPQLRDRWRRVAVPADMNGAAPAEVEYYTQYTVMYFRARASSVVGARVLHSIFDFLSTAAVARKTPSFLPDFSGVEHPPCEVQYCRGYTILAVALPYEPIDVVGTGETLPSAAFGELLSREHDVPPEGFGWGVGEASGKVYLLPGLTEFGVHERGGGGADAKELSDDRKKAALKCVVGLHNVLTQYVDRGAVSDAVAIKSPNPWSPSPARAGGEGGGDQPVPTFTLSASAATGASAGKEPASPVKPPPGIKQTESATSLPAPHSSSGLLVPPLSPALSQATGNADLGSSLRPGGGLTSLGVGLLSPLVTPTLPSPVEPPLTGKTGATKSTMAQGMDLPGVQDCVIEVLEDQGLDHFALGVVYHAAIGVEERSAALVEMIARAFRDEWEEKVYIGQGGEKSPVAGAESREGFIAAELAATSEVFNIKTRREALWVETLVPRLKAVYNVDVAAVKLPKEVVRRAWTRALTLCGVAVSGGRPVKVSSVARRSMPVMAPQAHQGLCPEDFTALVVERAKDTATAFALPPLYLAQGWLSGDLSSTTRGLIACLRNIPADALASAANLHALRRLKAKAAQTLLAIVVRQKLADVGEGAVHKVIEELEATPTMKDGAPSSYDDAGHEEIGVCLVGIGEMLMGEKQWTAAQGYLDLSVRYLSTVRSAQLRIAQNNLGVCYFSLGDGERATVVYREMVQQAREENRPMHSTINNLATLLYRQGTPESWREAQELYEEAVPLAPRPSIRDTTTANLTRVHAVRRKWGALKLQARFRGSITRARMARRARSTPSIIAIFEDDATSSVGARLSPASRPAASPNATAADPAVSVGEASGYYSLLHVNQWLHGYGVWAWRAPADPAAPQPTHWFYVLARRDARKWVLARLPRDGGDAAAPPPHLRVAELEVLAEGADAMPVSPDAVDTQPMAWSLAASPCRPVTATILSVLVGFEEEIEPRARAKIDVQETSAWNALVSQAETEGEAPREAAEREVAAVQIQAVQRGRAARKEVEAKRQARALEDAEAAKKKEEEEAAAAKKKEEEEATAAAKKQKEDDEAAAAAAKQKEEEDAEAAKKKEEEEAAAATHIQAVQRGRAARKEAEAKRQARALEDAEAVKKKEEEEAAAAKKKEEEEATAAAKKQKEDDEAAAAAAKQKEEEETRAKKKQEEEEAAAATHIQAVQRGRAARKEAEAKRQARAHDDAEAAKKKEEEEAAQQEIKEAAAATQIQAAARGAAVRKDVARTAARKVATDEEAAARKDIEGDEERAFLLAKVADADAKTLAKAAQEKAHLHQRDALQLDEASGRDAVVGELEAASRSPPISTVGIELDAVSHVQDVVKDEHVAWKHLVLREKQSGTAAVAVSSQRELVTVYKKIEKGEAKFRSSLQAHEALEFARLLWKAEQNHTRIMIGLVKAGREYEYFLSLMPKAGVPP